MHERAADLDDDVGVDPFAGVLDRAFPIEECICSSLVIEQLVLEVVTEPDMAAAQYYAIGLGWWGG